MEEQVNQRNQTKQMEVILDELERRTGKIPHLLDFIMRLETCPAFSEMKSAKLEGLARQTLEARRDKKWSKGRHEAMNRTVPGGFETNKRRH